MPEIVDRARVYVTEMLSAYSRHAGSQLSAAIAHRVGLIALGVLLWGASGMMASIRIAFRLIWDRESGPTYVRSKLRDFALVGLGGALVVAAFGLSVVVRLIVSTGTDLSDALGWTGGATALPTVVEVVSSALVVFTALLALYRFVPPVTMPRARLWPSALAAAIAFHVAVYGYAVYATHFSSFSSIYGPIGAVLALLLLVHLLAIIVLLGAETAAARTRER